MKDITNKTKLTLLLIFWAVIFLIAGMGVSARANANNMAFQYGVLYPQYVRNANCEIEKILVEKSQKKMHLIDCNGNVVKSYNVVTGKNKGAKQCDGDKKTPEGTYHIVEKRDSKYHRFLALDYPQAKDIKKAKELGCKPGDSIGIHGWIEGLPLDGSLGCVRVMTKDEIMEIDKMVKVGAEVEIRP